MATIEITHSKQAVTDAITIEQYRKRRIHRRRRVAKRMAKRFPMMAVEFMQQEFPGYTYEQFEEDIIRKKQKSRPVKKGKSKSFDWAYIAKDAPDFFKKCFFRSKGIAKLRFRLKNGDEYICTVRAIYYSAEMGYGEVHFKSFKLVQLWQGTLKDFLAHPGVSIEKVNNLFGE